MEDHRDGVSEATVGILYAVSVCDKGYFLASLSFLTYAEGCFHIKTRSHFSLSRSLKTTLILKALIEANRQTCYKNTLTQA